MEVNKILEPFRHWHGFSEAYRAAKHSENKKTACEKPVLSLYIRRLKSAVMSLAHVGQEKNIKNAA